MTRERLVFKTILARIDAGLTSGDIYDLLNEGFKGYKDYSDDELKAEYFNLTGETVNFKEGV